jgi:hypothetical protein
MNLIHAVLRVETTSEEREATGCIAYQFIWYANGDFSVAEDWTGMDEIYSDGVAIRVPARIWAEWLLYVSRETSLPQRHGSENTPNLD